jgi:hypothetical protein
MVGLCAPIFPERYLNRLLYAQALMIIQGQFTELKLGPV